MWYTVKLKNYDFIRGVNLAEKIFEALTNDIAIDMGTDNTRIYYKGNIIV